MAESLYLNLLQRNTSCSYFRSLYGEGLLAGVGCPVTQRCTECAPLKSHFYQFHQTNDSYLLIILSIILFAALGLSSSVEIYSLMSFKSCNAKGFIFNVCKDYSPKLFLTSSALSQSLSLFTAFSASDS